MIGNVHFPWGLQLDGWMIEKLPPGKIYFYEFCMKEIVLFDHNIILVQQSGQAVQGKFCFFNLIDRGIDGKVECGAQIRLFEYGIFKFCIAEIAAIEKGRREVTFGKVHFVQIAIFENRVFYLQAEKGRMIEQAILKTEREAERIAIVK